MVQSLILTEEQDKIFKKNVRLAYYYAHKYSGMYRMEIDDAIQQCLVGLAWAVQEWNPELGELSTIAFYRMRRMMMEQERIGRLIKGHQEYVPTVGDQMMVSMHTDEDVANDAVNKVQYQRICEVAKKYLNEWNYKVFYELYIVGTSQKDVAEKYGLTKQRISQMTIQIRDKLRKHLGKELNNGTGIGN